VCNQDEFVGYENGFWVCVPHVNDPDAHHPANAQGIDIVPNSVTVGESLLSDGRIDLGPEADDHLSVQMVRSFVVGGDADALHQHAAQTGSGTITALDTNGFALATMAAPRSTHMTLHVANAYCLALEHDGFDDWRVPSFDELRHLMLKGALPRTPTDDHEFFWSASFYRRESTDSIQYYAPNHRFAIGAWDPDANNISVYCVR
jgi:hypothetical protein